MTQVQYFEVLIDRGCIGEMGGWMECARVCWVLLLNESPFSFN